MVDVLRHTHVAAAVFAAAVVGVAANEPVHGKSGKSVRAVLSQHIHEILRLQRIVLMNSDGDEAVAIVFHQEFNSSGTARTPTAPASCKFFHHSHTVHGKGGIHLRDGAAGFALAGRNVLASHFYELHREGHAHGFVGCGQRRLDVAIVEVAQRFVESEVLRGIAESAAQRSGGDSLRAVVGDADTECGFLFADEGTGVGYIVEFDFVGFQPGLANGDAVQVDAIAEVRVAVHEIAHVSIVKCIGFSHFAVVHEERAVAVTGHDVGVQLVLLVKVNGKSHVQHPQ